MTHASTSSVAAIGPRRLRWLPVGLLTLAALAVLALVMTMGIAIGEIPVPLQTVHEVLSNRLLGSHHPVDPIDEGIVWNYRLTRAIVAACCGAALAVSGVVLQSLLRNALADGRTSTAAVIWSWRPPCSRSSTAGRRRGPSSPI